MSSKPTTLKEHFRNVVKQLTPEQMKQLTIDFANITSLTSAINEDGVSMFYGQEQVAFEGYVIGSVAGSGFTFAGSPSFGINALKSTLAHIEAIKEIINTSGIAVAK